jgi:hypothetical protein
LIETSPHCEFPEDSERRQKNSNVALEHLMWTMDDWQYVEREVVTDPKGRKWTVALMDVLGQEGDPDRPDTLLELQYSSGRYFTLIYAGEAEAGGGTQWERGYKSRDEASDAYRNLLVAVMNGSLDPSQPVFRENLED